MASFCLLPLSTRAALLTRGLGVNPQNCASSVRSFEGQDVDETSPSRIQHTISGAGASKADDVQVFVKDGVVTVDKGASRLVMEVPSTVRDPAMLSGNLPLEFSLATAAPLFLVGLPLQQANPALSLLGGPGCFDELTV